LENGKKQAKFARYMAQRISAQAADKPIRPILNYFAVKVTVIPH